MNGAKPTATPTATAFPWQDWLAWAAARLGWPGLTGLALLAVSLAACLLVVAPMETEALGLAQEAQTLAQRQARSQAAVQAQNAHSAALQDWRTQLPGSHVAYERLTRLFQAAESAGLALDEGSYRTQVETRAGLTRLLVTLPVAGTYPDLRRFLAQALNQDAALALEGLRFTRDTPETPNLEAELRFAFYLGNAP